MSWLSKASIVLLDFLETRFLGKYPTISSNEFEFWIHKAKERAMFIFMDEQIADRLTLLATERFMGPDPNSQNNTQVSQIANIKLSLSEVQKFQEVLFVTMQNAEMCQEQNHFKGCKFIESERLKTQLQNQRLVQDDLIARYVEFLALELGERPPHAVIGMFRMIGDYELNQAQAFYARLGGKDWNNWENQRARMVNKLKERFSTILNWSKSAQSGRKYDFKRDTPGTQSEETVDFVYQCMDFSKTWCGMCFLETKSTDVLAWIKSVRENNAEAVKSYVVYSPPDFEEIRLLTRDPRDSRKNCLPPLSKKLSLPQFNMGNLSSNHPSPPHIQEQDMNPERRRKRMTAKPVDLVEFSKRLQHNNLRRANLSSDLPLFILANGWEVNGSGKQLSETGHTAVTVNQSCRMIEIVTEDAEGVLLLGIFILSCEELGRFGARWFGKTCRIRLEGGPEILFKVKVMPAKDGEEQYKVDIEYPRRQNQQTYQLTSVRLIRALALAVSIVVVLAGLWFWLFSKHFIPQNLSPVVKHPTPIQQPSPLPVPPSQPKEQNQSVQDDKQVQNPKSVTTNGTVKVESPHQKPEPEKSAHQNQTPKSQRQKKSLPSLYIECGDSELEQRYCVALKAKLSTLGKWEIVPQPEKNSIILRRETLLANEGAIFRLELEYSGGETFWRKKETITEDNYLEKVEATASELGRLPQVTQKRNH